MEVLKGAAIPSFIELPGYIVERDDFNEGTVPYTFVRPGGRSGSCFANSYRRDGEFLLMLKKRADGTFTVNWEALGPVNEQLRSNDDPWVRWVRDQVAKPRFALSCGTFSPETTERDLIARFGANHVSSGPVFGLDDAAQQGTILFAQQPDARVEIIWSDPDAKRSPWLILVREPASRWRTPAGIVVGTDLRTLERMNRRPFRLSGLQSERRGAVTSWAGGLAGVPESSRCSTGVYLQPPYDGTAPLQLMRQVSSGPDYSSGHPVLQALNPRVVLLTLSFTPPRPEH